MTLTIKPISGRNMNIKSIISKAVGRHQTGDVSAEDVINAYRLFLGRKPDDAYARARLYIIIRICLLRIGSPAEGPGAGQGEISRHAA
jgi:hypothetical protein